MSNIIQLGKPADLAKMGREIVRQGYPVFAINANKQPLDYDLGREAVLDCIANPSPEADEKSGLYLYTREPKDVTKLAKLPGCAGWAVPTGEISGVTAVDFDTYKDSPDLKAALEEMEADLQDTRQHRTLSGGVHYLFRGDDIASKNGVVEGLDVKGNGGYVVWPPTPGYKVSHDVPMLPLPDVIRDLMAKRSSTLKSMTIDGHLLEVAAGKSWHENILQVAIKAQRINMSALKCQERVIEAAELAVRKGLRSRNRLDALLKGELDRMFSWSEEKLGDDTEDLADVLKIPDQPFPFGEAPQELTEGPSQAPEAPDYMAWLSCVSHGVYEDDIIEDLIEVQSLGVLYGLPGTGKSFVAFDMAAHVATGRPWMGRYTRPCPVLYIAAEAGRVIEQRSLAWCKHYGIAEGEIDNMLIYSGGLDLTKPFKDQDRLIEALSAREWGMIVIDTIGAACGGTDLSSQEDWAVISNNLFKLIAQFKCHVLAVHHANKANTLFGSVYAQADAQTILKVVVEEDNSRYISNEKQRNLELMHGGLYFSFKSYTVGQKRTPDGELRDVSSAVITSAQKQLSDRELLMQKAGEILKGWAAQLPPSQVPTVAIENVGVDRRVVVKKDYALSALKAEGKDVFEKLNFNRPSNKSELWKFLEVQGFIASALPKEWSKNRFVGFMCD